MLSNKKNGFSLIELLISLGIIGIVLSAAVPSFIDFINRAKSEGITDTLHLDLQMARTTAISTGLTVEFQTGSSVGVNNWSVIKDGSEIKKQTIRSGEFSFFSSTNGYDNFKIAFSPDGFIKDSNGVTMTNITLSACNNEIKAGVEYQFNAVGKIKTKEITCS